MRSLDLYDEIKLSTFASNARIVQKHISLASCCFGMGLYEEGVYRISRANNIDLSSEGVKRVKALLSEDYLRKVVEKGLKGSDGEGVESLKKLSEKLSLERLKR